MNIGIDIRAIGHQRTGDETYTLQLIKSLARVDKKNTYFLYTSARHSEDVKKIQQLLDIENKNFKIKSVKAINRFLWTAWALPQQAKKDKVDILHVQYLTPLFATHNLKIVTTIHDVSFARYPQFIDKKDLWLLKLFIPLSLRRADKIIAVSKFTKQEIIDVYNIKKNKIEVIYNGGVAQEFLEEYSQERVLRFKEKYDIIKPYLLYLGTLQPRKNIPFLIKAFVQLKKQYKGNELIDNLELVLRGGRNGRNYDQKIDIILKKISQKNKQIHKQIKFIGYVSNEEAPFIFAGAKAFCFPSIYEGFGLPLLEAMTMQTPTVASNIKCFREIAASSSLLAKVNNLEDWVDKLHGIVTNKEMQDKYVKLGKRRTADFSWDKNAQETIQLYNNMN